MRVAILLLATCTLVWSVIASPLPRTYESFVKISYSPTVVGKDLVVQPLPKINKEIRSTTRPIPRKGEYNCGRNGERLCKLEPGVIPKNCNGVCQYPV